MQFRYLLLVLFTAGASILASAHLVAEVVNKHVSDPVLRYNLMDDFLPMTLIGVLTLAIAITLSLGYRSVKFLQKTIKNESE